METWEENVTPLMKEDKEKAFILYTKDIEVGKTEIEFIENPEVARVTFY